MSSQDNNQPTPTADENLLFGVLAWQSGVLTESQLLAAMQAWTFAKEKTLGTILEEQKVLSPEQCYQLNQMVDAHVKLHGGKAVSALASFSSVPDVTMSMKQHVDDDAIQASLNHISMSFHGQRIGSTDETVPHQQRVSDESRYRIVRPHARGGLGEVYVARDCELNREVALKEIQFRFADRADSRSRFLLEAEVTGGLEHPGIVPVYGLGHYEDGRPYYAMRFIKGDSLKDAIKAFHESSDLSDTDRNLELRKLLGRFTDVCEAISYAHSRGVLHRDLKPGNIMLGRYGETLVVDWGLAKVAGRDESSDCMDEKTLHLSSGSGVTPTVMGSAIGTPAYMPPEQASGRLDELGPASDVYSLGATLYHLLTGSAPFDHEDLALTLSRVQAGNFKRPQEIKTAISPSLEAICLKAMSVKPSDRYESPQALAEDIERFLADEPVTAIREPVSIRTKRWIRKNQTLVSTAAAVMIVASIATGIFFRETARIADNNARIEKQLREDADEARERAEQAELAAKLDRDAKAEALVAEQRARQQTMVALRSMTDEVVERRLAAGSGRMLTDEDIAFLRAIEQQWEAFAALKGDDVDSRSARAEGHARIGKLRFRFGEFEEAKEDFETALAIQKQLVAEFPDNSEFRYHLAATHNYRGNLLSTTGWPKEAGAEYAAALNIEKQLVADFPANSKFRAGLAKEYFNRGSLLHTKGRLQEARTDYDESLDIWKPLVAEYPTRTSFREELAKNYQKRGLLLRNTGRLTESESDYDSAMSVLKQLVSDFPSRPEFRQQLAKCQNHRGILLHAMGRTKESESELETALSIFRQLADDFPTRPEYRQDLAKSHINRGGILLAAGQAQKAESEYDVAHSIFSQLAADFPTRPEFRGDLANCYNTRGNLLRKTGRSNEALEDYLAALTILRQRAADFPDQPDVRNDVAAAYVNQALLEQQRGNLSTARDLLLEGQQHHLAALKSNPSNPTYRQFYRNHLGLLTQIHAGLLEPDEAIRVAATRRDVGWDPPADASDAALLLNLCIGIVEEHAMLNEEQRQEAMQFYADAAMKMQPR